MYAKNNGAPHRSTGRCAKRIGAGAPHPGTAAPLPDGGGPAVKGALLAVETTSSAFAPTPVGQASAGRMRVLRLVREAHDIRNKLAAMGEATEPPARAPARGPPFWASRALRIRADADAA